MIGRVVKIEPQRWFIDIEASQWAYMDIAAVVVEREGYQLDIQEDCLHMRKYFCESDLLAAEVQQVSDSTGGI